MKKLGYIGAAQSVRDLYRNSFLGEFYYRILNFIIKEKLVVKEVLGFEMILDISKSGLEKDLFLHGIREKESTRIFSDYLEEGMDVVDIGANIGYYSFLEADNVGDNGRVTAIEPTPSSFRKLEKNCRLNEFENIGLLNKAVGPENGSVSIKERTSHNLNRIQKSGKISVEQDSLDSIIDFDPDVVRMDVEGYELEILKGMDKTLESEGLILFLEVHPSKIRRYYEGNIEEFWNILAENDFEVKHLVRHPPRPKPLYFLKREYPPNKVLEPDMSIEKTFKEYSEFFEWESVFRVFLKKSRDNQK